jgi:hypothetical protein
MPYQAVMVIVTRLERSRLHMSAYPAAFVLAHPTLTTYNFCRRTWIVDIPILLLAAAACSFFSFSGSMMAGWYWGGGGGGSGQRQSNRSCSSVVNLDVLASVACLCLCPTDLAQGGVERSTDRRESVTVS